MLNAACELNHIKLMIGIAQQFSIELSMVTIATVQSWERILRL